MQPDPAPLDVLWGVAAIAAAIGRTTRQTEEAIYKGDLPAVKINGRWAVSRRKLVEVFEGQGAQQ